MNTYLAKPLAQIKKELASKEVLSPDSIDSFIGELEMMKMNIEQHIQNMPQSQEHHQIKSAAKSAVQNIAEILDLLEELVDAQQQNELIDEILALMDEINY